MIFLATELPGLQAALLTQSLTGRQWFACLGLAALLPLVIEGRKWLLRRARARRRRPWTSSARSRRAAREPDEHARATALPVPRRTR